ncbi:MAG: hypothetical protein COB09_19105 [Thalassobium sp.]|nr:MAG: hypothetical protein COB09_19105 [Thalassobium sp.]
MNEVIAYYINLLIIQYHNKPNAMGTIELLATEFLANNIYLDVQNAYNIDTAVGVQLDVLGKYADIDRFYYNFELTDNYFGFADAVDVGSVSANIIGFDDAAAPDKEGLFLSSDAVISNNLRLNDDSYRTLIKLRIIQNNSTHGVKPINDSLFEFFGTTVLMKDNYDMTMTYFIADVSNELISAVVQKNVLPRPAGVGSQVLAGAEFFGMADATNLANIPTYIVGFNDATVGLTKDGRFLNANSDIL